MIVVEPSSAKFEVVDQAVSSDEHLLERISIVENRISRLTERLERSLDLLLRQAQNSYFDRSLVKTLISILTEDGLVETTRLEELWNTRCENDAIEQQEHSRWADLKLQILASPPLTDSQTFVDLVSEAFSAFEDHHPTIAIDKLQRAAEMADTNSALNLLIGEHFFRNGRPNIARSYLSKVHDASPDDVRVSLLLGLTCADVGEAKTAKKLLAAALEQGGSCFSGHYGLGWLLLMEKKQRKAVTHFKQALSICPSPEAYFALGSLYCEMERYELAAEHLKKATELDESYSEALELLALVYTHMGKRDLANAVRLKVNQTRASRGKPATGRRRHSTIDNHTKSLMKGLITGASKRLAAALREDALKAFFPSRSASR